MRRIAAGAALIILTLTAAPTPAAAHPGPTGGADTLSALARQIGRQALPTNDGWAAAGPGTTGGATATADQVHVVDSRQDLVAALGGNNATNATNTTPKIIYVKGEI